MNTDNNTQQTSKTPAIKTTGTQHINKPVAALYVAQDMLAGMGSITKPETADKQGQGFSQKLTMEVMWDIIGFADSLADQIEQLGNPAHRADLVRTLDSAAIAADRAAIFCRAVLLAATDEGHAANTRWAANCCIKAERIKRAMAYHLGCLGETETPWGEL